MDAGTDAGHDAGIDGGLCPRSAPGNPMSGATYQDDAGLRCLCEISVGTGNFTECCDPDPGNPCSICCQNLREDDGGRQYYADGGPVCLC
jgi:hypothetical protein